MRLLVVSHAPLSPDLGAAQSALGLASALRARGHDASAWSPEPLPVDTRWWTLREKRNRAINSFVEASGPYDVVDVPAISADASLARQARIVVRSIQPELAYLRSGLVAQLRNPSLRVPLHWLHGCWLAATILAGWARAQRIVCLGSLELEQMCRSFPMWRGKLAQYWCAPAPEDRRTLRGIRRQRRPRTGSERVRYLWIGRWSAHKGTRAVSRFVLDRAKTHPEDRFTFAGTGTSDLPELRACLGDRVRILPTFARHELPALLASHDAGLFTSQTEGWGLSLNEMLESGMVVFATLAGGVPDLAPFFPSSLRTFPPPQRLESTELEDLEVNGYYRRFDWNTIAAAYEDALGSLCEASLPAR